MIHQHPTQELRQDQTLTHQQIQALEFLAAPVCDLKTLITAEVAKNPLLECDVADAELDLPQEEAPEPADTGDDDSWMDHLLRLDDDSPVVDRRALQYSPEDEERRRHYLESITASKTLQEDLEEQLHFLDLPAGRRECCEVIIAAIDDHGYCTVHPADLAMATGESLTEVEGALAIVQSLEPAGVAARDLRDRLLIQLERSGRKDTFTYQVIREHFDDVANNRLPSLARKLRVALSDLDEVLSTLRTLRPTLHLPGDGPTAEYVEEEVSVVHRNGRIDIHIDAGQLPSLRINQSYKRLLTDPSVPADTKEYIRQKMRAAAYLIHNVAHRQQTLHRIVDAMVAIQRDYFIQGREHMKPMTMAAIAKRAGVHETTVSRAVAGKYLRCRYGLVPLRRFFSTGYQNGVGALVSNAVVKDRIREIIEAEDPSAPLSDGRIAEGLKEHGLQVARRTVAKYRESMQIPACNQRRKYL